MSKDKTQDQLSHPFLTISEEQIPVVFEVTKEELLPGTEPEAPKKFWCGYELKPYAESVPFVQEEYYGGVDPDLNKEKIPPRADVAPPLPKPFDPSLSVPPSIGPGMSIPEYRIRCAICRSINQGQAPPPHDCRQYQEDSNGI